MRVRIPVGAALMGALFLLIATPPLRAQDSASVQDSLLERLERAERAIERLTREMQTQDRSKVGSRLRNNVELSGMVLVNGFSTTARVNNSDVPTIVVTPQDSSGLPNAHLGGQVRQSRIGLTISGANALGAMLSGDFQLDFYGGQQPSSGGRTFPLPRIRTAFVRLDWRHVGLLVGQESQLTSPLNPVSFAAVGLPGYTNAGNLWFWIPQARLTYQTGGSIRFGVQGAALAPMLDRPQPAFLTQPDSAEKSRRPNLQARGYVSWGFGDTESQVGFGVHRGWIATTGDTLMTTEALTADARIMFGEKAMLQGEFFYNGRGLAALGGGGVGQQFGAAGAPVDSRGGWVQLNLRPTFSWELGGGYGLDDPDDADLPAGARLKNVHITGHLHYRPGGGLLMGAEFRRVQTTYSFGEIAANHINGFVGLAF